ncbi:MAG: glycoside hydrolase family 3 N-terminal domain-containing protein [Lachnospiraceae bacterium]|nr:glycoside hydrolase family 3 N-terminal domain-containing protein [Lachnospiraceae bacterium]
MINLKGNPFYLSENDIQWVMETKESLSLEEKLQQLFFPIGYSANEDYLKYEILGRGPGGMMFRAGNKAEILSAYSYLQKNAKVPMFLSANLEAGGDGLIVEGTAFGKQMQVAATGNPQEAYRLGLISCREARAVGGNYAFAPVVDIDMNYHNPITNVRTYGSDKEMVKRCGLEYMRAAKECELAVSIKHFPGDGVDETDQHILTSVNSLSCEEWDETFGDVYKTLIDAGALTTMIGHIAMPAYQKRFNPEHPNKLMPASLSPELLQNLLREQLGFNGMIITDASPMVGFLCAMDREKSVPYCIEAGCDMILFNKEYDEDLAFMKKGYETGILSEERLDEALTRILATKAAMKLHTKRENGTLIPKEEDMNIIGCDEHLQWAKECADKSVTLVKDTQNLLPINPQKHKRVLYEIMGECESESRVTKRFFEKMEAEGFEMIPYEKEYFDFSKPMKFESVTEFRDKYDLVIYIGNVENASNKTTNRLNWHAPYGAGNNIPWFVDVVPTMFISLQNPYHLLDVPMVKTYINAYSNHDAVIDAVVDKILGKSEFKGVSPVDPFCGKEYLAY